MIGSEAQDAIRKLAADRSRLKFTCHALKRKPEKGKYPVSERQVAQCLQNCVVTEDPSPDIKLANGWKFTCERPMEEATIVVAGVLVPERMILVVTAYENRPFRRRSGTLGDDYDDESTDLDNEDEE